MAERRELGFQRKGGCSLKEQLAKTTLNNVRSQGHTYVELREDGKRFIFFCTLCLAPCYSDSVLLDHLKGSLHTERLAAAKVTLLGTNPWPFNDGVLFFGASNEKEKQSAVVNDNSILAVVKYVGNQVSSGNKQVNGKAGDSDLVIPGVLMKDEISDLKVNFIGYGEIAARFFENGVSNIISRIWCEWLGKEAPINDDMSKVSKHEFAVVTFVYNCDLGRKGFLDDVKSLLTSGSTAELDNGEAATRKRKKSFSDPEDSGSLRNQYDSSGEDSSASNGASSSLALARYDDQFLLTRFISNKAIRRELRRQQRVAAERMCDICRQKMLPEKDVAALMNLNTGKLVCSSRNVNGAFHLFHTSCLIHWILLCEVERIENQPINPKLVRRRSRRKSRTKSTKTGKNGEAKPAGTLLITSVLCPECQGSGIEIEGDELEKPEISLSQMFRYKIKVSDGRREWMKNPEILENCSTGFHFPSLSDKIFQEKVMPLKLLHFYSADMSE
ncbi:uncharacterized protein LOC120150968 isoform X2 [Hibiscus syriacus]|uniref:uncharacterized protein LOC120150968 isoform X2 n=1 Tax=Hibiscus syriacus TaxID=106335 RepID=UPI00192306E2|nr:uncharacterized protein LOC120150968 isoform X2 [Hibiscus syriacus]